MKTITKRHGREESEAAPAYRTASVIRGDAPCGAERQEINVSDFLTTADGRWTPSGVRQRRALVASAEWMNKRGRAWTYFTQNTVLATIRRTGTAGGQSWIVHVHGHEFLVTPDMPSARIWPVGSYISVKAFPTSSEAKRAVLRVLAQMPVLETA